MSAQEVPAMRERVVKLETIVGDDATSGLRGDMKNVFKRLNQIEVRMYMAMGGGMTLVYVLDRLLK